MYVKVFVFLWVLEQPGVCPDSNTTNLPLSTFVADLLDKLCRSVDICNANAKNPKLTVNGWLGDNFVSCCTGCSCHPDCKKTQNCCFPNDSDTDNTIEKSAQKYQCLPSAIANPGEKMSISVESYYTVVEEPRGGCISKDLFSISSDLSLFPSCDDTFGEKTYFPVYSKSTGDIYKNIQCARCHGIRDTQFSYPVLIYGRKGRIKVNSFSEILSFFDRIPSGSHIEFRFDNPRLVSHKRCFQHVTDTCETDSLKNFPVLDNSDIDLSVIQDLCKSSVYSPYPTSAGVYKNVFCFLCGRQTAGPLTLDCQYRSLTRFENSAFTNLIKPSVYLGQQFVSRKIYHELCLSANRLKDDGNCHKVYCPTGRTMDNKGQCVFISHHWASSPLQIHVKLLPLQHEDHREKLRQMQEHSLKDTILKNSPWPKEWEIFRGYVRYDDSICNERADVLVELVFEKGNPSEFVPQIKKSLGLFWTFVINGQTLVFDQYLSEYSLQAYPDSMHLFLPQMTEDNMYECESILWELKTRSSRHFNESPLTISKLFLCEQIQLTSREFELGRDRVHLRSNLTRRILYEFEFELIKSQDGYNARVCKEDTILQEQRNEGVRQPENMVALFLVFLRSI